RNLWLPRFKRKNESLYMDLFIFDHTSDKVNAQKKQILKLKFLQGTLKDYLMLSKGNFIAKSLSVISYLIGKPFSTRSKLNLYDKISASYSSEKTNFIISSQDQFRYIHNVLPSSIVDSYTKVPFEDTQLKIMTGYHTYLNVFH